MDEKEHEEKSILVNVIIQAQKTAVVEYQEKDDVRRVVVPVKSLQYKGSDVLVSEGEIRKGMVYGYAWEELVFPTVDSAEVARILHKYGIWTKEDARKNRSALMSAVRDIFNPFIRLILEPVEGGKK